MFDVGDEGPIFVTICVRCSAEILGRRKDAKYCSKSCAGIARTNKYTERNPAKVRQRWRDYFFSDKGTVTALLNNAQDRARKQQVPCTITREFVEAKYALGACELTGIRFQRAQRPDCAYRAHPYAPSLDKIVPALGYVPDNVRIVVFAINRAKSEYTDELLYELAEALLNHRKGLTT